MQNKMMKLALSMGLLIGLMLWLPAAALAQSEPTPTPDNAVPITIEVLPNDSLWEVAARAGLSLAELLTLNGMSENDVIQPGQQLIIGYSTPEPTLTPVILPTVRPTLPPPTPSRTAVPQPPTGICLTAFRDVNGNGIQEAVEPLKTAVAFTIFNDDVVIANYVTDGAAEPYCIENLAEGTYHITRSLGPNEVLTTPGDRGIIVRSGEMVHLVFGSVQQGEVETAVPADEPAGVIGETAVPPPLSSPDVQNESAKGTGGSFTAVLVGTLIILLLLGGGFLIIRNNWEG